MKKISFLCLALLTAGMIYAEGIYNKDGLQYYAHDDGTATLQDFDDEVFTGTVLDIPETVTFGDLTCSVTSIVGTGTGSLRNKNLTEVHIPASITSIYASAFANNKAIKRVYWDARKLTTPCQPFAASGTALKEVYVNKHAEELCDGMFQPNSAISTLFIGEDGESVLKKIGANAFAGNTELKRLDFTNCEGKEGVEIGTYAFANCAKLRVANLAAVSTIGNQAFQGCEALEDVTLPNINKYTSGVSAQIGDFAFQNCKKLDILVFNAESNVGERAFADIADGTELRLTLNHKVELGEEVFENVVIESVTIACDMRDVYAADEKWTALYAEPEAQVVIEKELTPEMLIVANESAAAAGCHIEVVSSPDCDHDYWVVRPVANETEGWFFCGWAYGAGCEPEHQITVSEVADDPYFDLRAQFAKADMLSIPVYAETNIESLGGIKAYVCDALLPRDTMAFFEGEDATFIADEDPKGWVEFSSWTYEEPEMAGDPVNIDNEQRSISFHVSAPDPISGASTCPSSITAVYNYADVDVTVRNAVMGEGDNLTSVSNPVKLGSQIELKAQPSEGYTFKEWRVGSRGLYNGKVLGTEAEMKVTVHAAHLCAETTEQEDVSLWYDGGLMALTEAQTLGDHFVAEYIAVFEKEDVGQGVEDVRRDDVQCTKVLRDGVLYIMYNGTMYNVQGKKVK